MDNKIPTTQILFGDEAKAKVLKGIDILNKAVSSTLGPRSDAVGMVQDYPGFSVWKINKDGVSVAKAITLENKFEDFGVKVVREAAQKTVDEVGDGTTVTIILAKAIIDACMRYMASGYKGMALRKGLEDKLEILNKRLKKLALPVTTLEEKINVATISASGDRELGKLIAEQWDQIGIDGILTVEETKNGLTTAERQEGMQLDRGLINPFFMTDPDKQLATYEDIYCLITDKPLKDLSEAAPLLNLVIQNTKKLVIITPELAGDLLPKLLELKLKGEFYALPLIAPGVAQNQKDILQDLSALTGATFISHEAGQKLKDVTMSDLGFISRITTTKVSTVIAGGKGKKSDIDLRIATIKKQMEDDTLSDFDQEKLRERLGKLTRGIAVIKIGGTLQVDMQERKERALDAVGATVAAIRDGIVPGGETIYLRLKDALYFDSKGKPLTPYDQILSEALEKPFRVLVSNAGMDAGEKMAELKVLLGQDGKQGLDVVDERIKDMAEAGIIDPVSVSLSALKNALAVAIQVITLGAVIVPSNEKTKKD